MSDPKKPSASGPGQELDPLEELARLMDDTKDTASTGAQSEPAGGREKDPLDLGLGDQGLAELFGERPIPGGNKVLDEAMDPFAGQSEDPLFKDLSFGDLNLQGAKDEPQPDTPTLTDHLTPRTSDGGGQASGTDDLLAAMDALALDEPTTAPPPSPTASSAAVPPNLPPLDPAPSAAPAFSSAPSFAPGSDPLAPPSSVPFNEPAADNDTVNFHEFEPDEETSRGGINKFVLMGLGAVAVLGVGGVLAFGILGDNSVNDPLPQVIAASDDDDKVEPVEPEIDQSRPGDAVFSTLDDQTSQSDPENPRIVLPQPGSTSLDLSEGDRLPSVDIAPAPPGSTASRAVRTVTVRADGTIVESTTEPTPAATEAELDAPQARPVEILSVSPSTGVSTNTEALEQALQQQAATVENSAQAAAQAALDEATQAVTSALPPAPVARPDDTVRVPQAAPLATSAPAASTETQVASAPVTPPSPTTTPIQLAAPNVAPAQPTPVQAAPASTQVAATQPALPANVAPGEFIVQLASLRSEDDARATFSRLQNQFGSILGGFQPNIQRADLGDRGIYHRVRIGPMERGAADSLCQRYQAAGGDCFVQRQ